MTPFYGDERDDDVTPPFTERYVSPNGDEKSLSTESCADTETEGRRSEIQSAGPDGECFNCGGTGDMPDHYHGQSCTVCNGTGKVDYRFIAGDESWHDE